MHGLPVAVIGGGPAGMSAALWLKLGGHHPVVFEVEPRLGGLQRVSNYANPVYLGLKGLTANAMAETFSQHLDFELIPRVHGAIEHVTASAQDLTLTVSQTPHSFPAATLCVGTRLRRLTVPGSVEAEAARRLRYLGIACRPHEALGHAALVIGSGDNAFAMASELARYARAVVILARSRASAQPVLMSAALSQPNVELREGHAVERFEDGGVIVKPTQGPSYALDCLFSVAAVGFEPNTDFFRAQLKGLQLDRRGYVLTDADGKTSVPRLWAAGDVCDPVAPSSIAAAGAGSVAARDIERFLRGDHLTRKWTLRTKVGPRLIDEA
jgi:thioredoxin reductase (NADPH)